MTDPTPIRTADEAAAELALRLHQEDCTCPPPSNAAADPRLRKRIDKANCRECLTRELAAALAPDPQPAPQHEGLRAELATLPETQVTLDGECTYVSLTRDQWAQHCDLLHRCLAALSAPAPHDVGRLAKFLLERGHHAFVVNDLNDYFSAPAPQPSDEVREALRDRVRLDWWLQESGCTREYIDQQLAARAAARKPGTKHNHGVREALRALLAALSIEESNRDGEFILPPDPGCIRCTRGVADSGKLCARHAAESALAKEPGRG